MSEVHLPNSPHTGNIAPSDCPEGDCPGYEGFETSYGLASGGLGAYTYCPKCFRIIDKSTDPT